MTVPMWLVIGLIYVDSYEKTLTSFWLVRRQ